MIEPKAKPTRGRRGPRPESEGTLRPVTTRHQSPQAEDPKEADADKAERSRPPPETQRRPDRMASQRVPVSQLAPQSKPGRRLLDHQPPCPLLVEIEPLLLLVAALIRTLCAREKERMKKKYTDMRLNRVRSKDSRNATRSDQDPGPYSNNSNAL